jgi:putative transposase
MARLARLVIPGSTHHVVHHARPEVPLFRDSADFARYRDLLIEKTIANAVAIEAWCLLPGHVHLLLTPQTHEGLAMAVGEAHRLYARHRDLGAAALWAGRFRSCPVSPSLVSACMGYIESNPARLRLASWAWVSSNPGSFPPSNLELHTLRAATRRGLPAGDPDFVAKVEYETGRVLTRKRRGRKPKW